jgi:Zn-dependent protease with chaperone function
MLGMAILSLIIITDIFVFIALGLASTELQDSGMTLPQNNPALFLIVGCIVMVVIVIGSTYKWMVLSSGGGRYIAESMGGRLLLSETDSLEEKRLLNVVEEMAIASGMPVPQVYVMDDEPVINAFAAGLTTGDAVIGVTKGTIESLNRDELQGVIAHEYSHILNGDMSLNIQLMGLLHGILIIGIIGYYIVRSTSRSRSKDSGSFVFLGLGLIAIGYGGTFFGNLIKASISRQREYLADASAVQFTRNPEGIAGALKKIGGTSNHSQLNNEHAPEMSHAYFSQGVTNYLGSLTATHPPLEDRIRRIDKRWDGKFISPEDRHINSATNTDKKTAPTQEEKRQKLTGVLGSVIVADRVMSSMQHMGNPGDQELNSAREIIKDIPEDLRDASHNPYGARAVIYCMLINRESSVKAQQLKYIETNGDRGIYELCQKYLDPVHALKRRYRLPLIDMAMPAIRELSKTQYDMFKKNTDALIAADASLDLFEWSLRKILYKHLGEAFHEIKTPKPKYNSFKPLHDDCQSLISVLAHAGHKEIDVVRIAYNKAMDMIGIDDRDLLPKSDISLTNFDAAVDKLNLIQPLSKKILLNACLACITADEKITSREVELLRAVADTLNCPIPPINSSESKDS